MKNNNSFIMPDLNINHILKSTPGYVYWKNLDSVYIGGNLNQANLVGFNTQAEMIGKTDYDFPWGKKDPRIADKFVQDDKYVIATGKSLVVEDNLGIKNSLGQTIIVRTEKTPLLDNKGNIVGVLGIAVDITQAKEIDTNYILKSAPGYIYWKDLNSVYMGCNQNTAALYGFKDPKDIIGLTEYQLPYALIRPDTVTHNVKADKHVIQTGESIITEDNLGIENANGYPIILRSEKRPLLDKKGNIIGVLGVSIDITDTKRAKKLELEKILERTRIVHFMSGAIAHELRSPLTVMNVSAQSIKRILQNNLRNSITYNECLKHLNNIQNGAESSNNFIDFLLSNIQKLAIEQKDMELVSIKACIEETIKNYSFSDDANRLLVNLEIKDFQFKGVPSLMEHVLSNLMDNALYFIKAAGKGQIFIWTELGKEWNTLHFKDTGFGIKKEYLNYLFTRFFSKREKGTGIGLAFCRRVMGQFGGTINCDSIEGEYTHFTLKFPIINQTHY